MEKLSHKNRHKFQILKDKDGNIFHLDEKIASGSEGTIYTIQENPDVVAKIYKLKLYKDKRLEKIDAMCNIYDEQIAEYCALPKFLLYDSCGNIAGYVMERIVDYGIMRNLLYIGEYYNFNFKDYIQIAINIAEIFDKLFDKDILICDINTKNIMINKDCSVKFIDCDSFQFEYSGKTYFQSVGVFVSIPPEFKGIKNYETFRNKNNSVYGLAVLIFMLLTNGLNPYINPNSSFNVNEYMNFEYQYDNEITNENAKLLLMNINDEIKKLFKCAFIYKENTVRPTPTEWIEALKKYQKTLVECKNNKNHYYNSETDKCVWCELEKTGYKIF